MQRLCALADRLEEAIAAYLPMESYLETAIRYATARTGHRLDDELFALLLHRYGVTEARLAVERIRQMDLDSLAPA